VVESIVAAATGRERLRAHDWLVRRQRPGFGRLGRENRAGVQLLGDHTHISTLERNPSSLTLMRCQVRLMRWQAAPALTSNASTEQQR
jgi:hypothetical protein